MTLYLSNYTKFEYRGDETTQPDHDIYFCQTCLNEFITSINESRNDHEQISKEDIVRIKFTLDNIEQVTLDEGDNWIFALEVQCFSGLVNLRIVDFGNLYGYYDFHMHSKCFENCGGDNGIELHFVKPVNSELIDGNSCYRFMTAIGHDVFEGTIINKIRFSQNDYDTLNGKYAIFETTATDTYPNLGFKYKILMVNGDQTDDEEIIVTDKTTGVETTIGQGHQLSFFGSTPRQLDVAFRQPYIMTDDWVGWRMTLYLLDGTTIEYISEHQWRVEGIPGPDTGMYIVEYALDQLLNKDNVKEYSSVNESRDKNNELTKQDIVRINFTLENAEQVTLEEGVTWGFGLNTNVFSGLQNLRIIDFGNLYDTNNFTMHDGAFKNCGGDHGIEIHFTKPVNSELIDSDSYRFIHHIGHNVFEGTIINKIRFNQNDYDILNGKYAIFETSTYNLATFPNLGFKYKILMVNGDETEEEKIIVTDNTNETSETITQGNELSFFRSTPRVLDIGFSDPPCFVAGTLIKTDQGYLPIEQITTYNSIRGNRVCRVTECFSNKNFVLIKKNAFGKNRPNKDTLSTHWHGIYLNDNDKEFVRLKDLINDKTVVKQKHSGYVYNVELKNKHTYMYANNLKVETLIPGHRGW